MEFRFKDILKNIVPGMIICFSILIYINHTFPQVEYRKILASDLKEYSEILLVIILVVCYLLGYINDGISSLVEHAIYRLAGFPSLRLLTGKGRRISLLKPSEVINNIKSKLSLDDADIDIASGNYWQRNFKTWQLFKYANGLKTSNPNVEVQKRVEEFYLSYVFSRNILFAFIISIIVLFQSFSPYVTTRHWIFIAIIFISLMIRRRDKSYYYSREVFSASKYL